MEIQLIIYCKYKLFKDIASFRRGILEGKLSWRQIDKLNKLKDLDEFYDTCDSEQFVEIDEVYDWKQITLNQFKFDNYCENTVLV